VKKLQIFCFSVFPSVKKMANLGGGKKSLQFLNITKLEKKKKKKPASKLVTVKQNIDKTKHVNWNQGSRGWEGRSRQGGR
jgi:hypothetical protein